MSEAKQASLTVLGGPLGGSLTVLPDEGEVTIGSAEDCSFQLDAPGVSPLHARVVLADGLATVFSTGAERPLHINDNPLGTESATLRNGDILWLGVPGEDDVVMLQCILPPPAAAAPPPATVAEPTPDVETQALWIGSEDDAETEAPSPPPAEPSSEHEPLVMDFDSSAGQETVVEGEATFVAADEIAPVDLEGSEATVVVNEDELLTDVTPTLVDGPPDLTPPADEVLSAEPLDPDVPVALPPTPPVEPATPAPATSAPAPPAAAPTASGPSTPAAKTPPSRRERPAPRRKPAPPRDEREHEPDETERPSRSPVVLALVGFAGVLAVAIVGWVVWRFVLTPAPSPSPTPVAAATTAPPPVSALPPPQAEPPSVEPTPEPTATPLETAVPIADPTPPPVATPEPTPTPQPTPTPTPPPAAAAPPAAPPQPSAEEQRAQQTAVRVEGLLGQADTALAAQQYDTAIAHLDEALGLDPQDSRASTTRARAVALRDLANRRFVGGRTRVQTEKAQGGGLAGFDTGDADVRKAPDFQGRIEFEMNPASGVAAGDSWTLRIFVVNEGDKAIRIQGVDAVTQVNGAGGGGAVAPRTRQVPTQQRLLVGELSGTWVEGTNSWSTQATITANKGDSLRASLTWR